MKFLLLTHAGEEITGFDVVECRDREEALAIAAGRPAARPGTVEIRPLPAHDLVTGLETAVEFRTSATPEQVWDLVTDVARIGEWSPECTGAAWLEPAGPVVGARFESRNRYPDGAVSHFTCVVTEAARPGAFTWHVLDARGLPGSRWRYEIARRDGTTVVRHRFTHGPGNTGLRRAAQDPVAPRDVDDRLTQLRANMTRTLRAMLP